MTVYQALLKSNIEFKVLDSEIIGTVAALEARAKGIELFKVIETPWHKKEKENYFVNDYPESFIAELFSIIARHFTKLETPKKRRKRIAKIY